MKTDLECIPCIIKATLNTLDLDCFDENIKRKVLKKVLEELSSADLELSPANNSDIAYLAFSEITGVKDPYHNLKKQCNRLALELYPELEEIVENSRDKLHSAAKVAVAGNVIDFGISLHNQDKIDFNKIIKEIKNIPLARDDYNDFNNSLMESNSILYIADNAGEIVFDKIFITRLLDLGKEVILAVKSGPIINDATKEDILEVGLHEMVKIIETGNNRIGVNFRLASKEFKEEFEKADLIISKGQGNFETMDEINKKVFFLLKAKCQKIARELKVRYQDIVFIKNKTL